MYHEVADRSEVDELAGVTQRGYILEREAFDAQMSFLAEAGFHSISLDQLHDWSLAGRPLPANPVAITFDDGFSGNYRHACPILHRLGLNATFFVVTNRIGDAHMLSWENLRNMRALGMAIESHTQNHPLLSTLTEARTREELAGSKAAIEDKLGSPVRFLSLPNGDSNPYYATQAGELGYLGGCGSRFGLNSPATDRFFWRRIAVKRGMDMNTFRGLLSRHLGTLCYVGARHGGKAALARLLGKRNYDRLYNLVFGVREQDKSKQA